MKTEGNTGMDASFEDCCVRHLSDKAKVLGHSYCDFYEERLRRFVRPRILEIGTGSRRVMEPVVGAGFRPGASARALRDFFQARIVSVDLDAEASLEARDRDITTLTLDAYRRESVEVLRGHGPYDVVIDDGSHRPEHQRAFIEMYAVLVRPGGLLVVEDVMWRTAREFLVDYGGEVLAGGIKADDRLWSCTVEEGGRFSPPGLHGGCRVVGHLRDGA